jgi:activator of 2-hydroxyglutaryl-CoA dehydratase
VMHEQLGAAVNVPPEALVQYTGAIGAAVLAGRRLDRLRREGTAPERAVEVAA